MIRYLTLPVILAGALAMIHLLPSKGSIAQSAIKMELPSFVGSWEGVIGQPSKGELEILANDTEFAKTTYFRARSGESDFLGRPLSEAISVSVVLSGSDINSSIHRPERCLVAQGHFGMEGKPSQLKISNGHILPLQRLQSSRAQTATEDGKEKFVVSNLSYYFFVGHDQLTNDHTKRTLIDMKDRVILGQDQRWAYVTVSIPFGKLPQFRNPVSEEEADKKIRQFIEELAEDIIDWKQVQ